MKITVNVDEGLAQSAKLEAVKRKSSLGKLVEEGLRHVLRKLKDRKK